MSAVKSSALEAAAARLPYRSSALSAVLYYLIDWVAAGVVLGTVPLVNLAPTHERFFIPTDPTISYPYTPDTVSQAAVLGVAAGLPILVFLLTQVAMKCLAKGWSCELDMHHALLALFEANAVNALITVAIKVAVGRIRPSGMARLANNDTSFNKSYISGHSSFAFVGMVFTALYLSGKVGLFRSRGLLLASTSADPFRGSFASALLCILLPLAVSITVACSRLTDYAHFFSDVNAGAAVGTGSALLGYFSCFPALSSDVCFLCRPLALAWDRKTGPLSEGPSVSELPLHENHDAEAIGNSSARSVERQ